MGYFHDVHQQFGTELWVNNPALPEIQLGLEAGAVGIASNPRYIATILQTEPEFVRETIENFFEDIFAKTSWRKPLVRMTNNWP